MPLYKHVALLVRKPGLTHDEFVDYWRGTHTPIARGIEGVVKYTTVIPADPETAEFDGIAELYFRDLDALYDALGSEGSRDYDPEKPNAKAAREDVDNFLAIEDRPRLIGVEHVEMDTVAGDTDGLYKLASFLSRTGALSYEAFLDHWSDTHVPIARELPGLVRYVRVIPTEPSAAEFDGIAELYFETLGALEAAAGRSGTRDDDPDDPNVTAYREDLDDFLAMDERPRLVGRERVQKDETA